MFPRPKPRPILPRLGCARFLIYVSSLYWSGLCVPGLLEGLKMFPRPKPRPILPRLGCARFLIYVSSLYWSGLCAGALFFCVGGSKGGVLAPPNVRFCVVPELGSFTPTPTARSVGGFENASKAQASTHPPQARLRQVFDLCFVSILERSMCARSVGGFENVSKAQASTHPPQARLRQVFDLCFVSVLERSMCWGSFLLRRGFQRWCFGSAECTVLCCAGARF